MMQKEVRQEFDVFSELAKLCSSPGYVHAIAYLCFRDHTIKYLDSVTADDVLKQCSMNKLVRTEMSTLIGLACKNNLILDFPLTWCA
jgi:hypothetical protein